MAKIKLFEQFVQHKIEAVNEKIADKDWDRMTMLYVKDDIEGAKVARLIKDKKKAINRFVAGLKIVRGKLDFFKDGTLNVNYYHEIGRKALQLGATPEEIQKVYDEAEIPTKYQEKISDLEAKKLGNWVTGPISQAVLSIGGDVQVIDERGVSKNARTSMGKDAMRTNGANWTMNFKYEITINNKTYDFVVDIITDEGARKSHRYVIDNKSDRIFTQAFRTNMHTYGIREITKTLKQVFDSVDEGLNINEKKSKKDYVDIIDRYEAKMWELENTKASWIPDNAAKKDKMKQSFQNKINKAQKALDKLSANENVSTTIPSNILNEASKKEIFKAVKKGDYPATVVVVQQGKVTHQEQVKTPEIVPAVFSTMQDKYKDAIIHLEDKTGKRLHTEK